jgi:hypothetical protein
LVLIVAVAMLVSLALAQAQPAHALLPDHSTAAKQAHAQALSRATTKLTLARVINSNLKNSVAIANANGMQAGVAVYDTKTKRLFTAEPRRRASRSNKGGAWTATTSARDHLQLVGLRAGQPLSC